MDMGTSTMAMGMSSTAVTATSTAAVAAATASSTMSMDMGGSCKVSMLWNWYTIDACFLTSSWHITSRAAFAGTCIAVILLVMSLEFLRRASKEYERFILLQAKRNLQFEVISTGESKNTTISSSVPSATHFRPSISQQAIRAAFHMLQFAVAYLVMLLAMYFNGYILFCIVIGAFLGAFVFGWESIELGSEKKDEATYCCG